MNERTSKVYKKRQRCFILLCKGVEHVEDLNVSPSAVKSWPDASGVSKVLIHFDTDVSDPAEIIAAVGTDPNGMNIDEVVSLIGEIASEKELVGLTVAEPMPRTAIRIKNMLSRLPLLR